MRFSFFRSHSANQQPKSTEEQGPFFAQERENAFFGDQQRGGGAAPFFTPVTSPAIQTKSLTEGPAIGSRERTFEQQADAVADRVVQPVNNPAPALQTQCAECAAEEKEEQPQAEGSPASVQLRSDPGNTGVAGPALTQQLNTSRGGGRPLEDAPRADLEPALGADLSPVRIHTGPEAAQMNRQLGAQAFTYGSDIYFNEGKYRPETREGQHLLVHELVHVGQQGGDKHIRREETEQKAESADTPVIEGDLLEGWTRDPTLFLSLRIDRNLILLPGSLFVFSPGDRALAKYQEAKVHLPGDMGAFFGVPATGASGTRFVRSGKRNAIVFDAGRGVGVPAAVYLSQVQGIMALMGISGNIEIRNIHLHKDHTNGISSLVTSYNLKPANVIIPEPLIRGGQSYYRQVIQGLRALGGEWQNWTPGTAMANKGGQGDIIRNKFTTGDIVIESLALRSAMKNITAKNADLASYLTKVTRTTDQASILILGDLRMKDLDVFEQKMGSQKWQEFTAGVQKLSGFSHHAGRMDAKDLTGLFKLLDATLLKTGKLEVIVQTDLSKHTQARNETVELMRRMGIEVKLAQTSGSGSSGVVTSKNTTTTTGTGAQALSPIESPATAGLQRMVRLQQARDTIQTWRGIFEARGAKPQAIEEELRRIDSSIQELRTKIRESFVAASGVRTADKASDRNYQTGARGAAYQGKLANIPATTAAEQSIGPQGFKIVEELQRMPTDKLPLRVALERALIKGEYSPQAFTYMLSQIDPATRKSLLTGKRGGMSPKQKAFERVRATYMFRSSVLPSGQFWSTAGFSKGKARAAKGMAGVLAFVEVANIAADFKEGLDIQESIKKSRDVMPFVKRIMFWNQLGVKPHIVGVEDNWFSSNHYEHDYDNVIEGIRSNRWDAVYIEHNPGKNRFAISDVDLIRFGVTLTHLVRNFDEFATLFLDSDQDAITWENQGAGWEKAIWKIRVGKFDTDWENEVEERWIEIPEFSQIMQMFVKRIIANTKEILAMEGQGKAPDSTEADAEVGGLVSRGKPTHRAALSRQVNSTKVRVIPDYHDCYWDGRSTRNENPNTERSVEWWSPPEFYVFETNDQTFTVGGADYNTYAILRMLETYTSQCVADRVSLNRTIVYRTSNDTGLVEIPKSDLTLKPLH